MSQLSPTNHRSLGRTVHAIQWPEPVEKTCPTCGLKFVELRVPGVACCEACVKTSYEAWLLSYCPDGKPSKTRKQRKTAEGAPAAPKRVKPLTAEKAAQVIETVHSLQERLAAARALMAAMKES